LSQAWKINIAATRNGANVHTLLDGRRAKYRLTKVMHAAHLRPNAFSSRGALASTTPNSDSSDMGFSFQHAIGIAQHSFTFEGEGANKKAAPGAPSGIEYLKR
jgi:hypothetical protein